jgi:methylenetetrahydrofolate dehydrogenase (NADP+)/methenyltetrahydrofolate cyclohydrolase
MTAAILDGRKLADVLKDEIRREVSRLKAETGAVPRLVNIIMGSDPGSCSYARSQQKIAGEVGIQYDLLTLAEGVSRDELAGRIKALNDDPAVNGIMIHKPVPARLDYRYLANFIDTAKDLEGINVANIGKMVIGETTIIPCTPAAVMELLRAAEVPLRGKEAVIVGASEIVGKPLGLLLLREWATVTVCHLATSEAGRLRDHISRADILIVAAGKPGLVPGQWIKPGAVVIDVGINEAGGKIVGDVDFASALSVAGMITPVPGGVGPVTVAMLMRNGLEAFKQQREGSREA